MARLSVAGGEAYCRPDRLLVPCLGFSITPSIPCLDTTTPKSPDQYSGQPNLFVFGDVFFGDERAKAMQPRILRQVPEFADFYAVEFRKTGQFRDHSLNGALFFLVRENIRVRSTVPSLTASNMTFRHPCRRL